MCVCVKGRARKAKGEKNKTLAKKMPTHRGWLEGVLCRVSHFHFELGCVERCLSLEPKLNKKNQGWVKERWCECV